jgi:hypothetical protein
MGTNLLTASAEVLITDGVIDTKVSAPGNKYEIIKTLPILFCLIYIAEII